MAELAGAPWRGYARVDLESTGDRRYSLSTVDVDVFTDSDDRSTWQFEPGDSFTLRLEWDSRNTPVYSQADSFTAEVRLPNGTQIGSAWTGSISGASGSLTRTFHFDDDPLDEIAGAARCGMLELYLLVEDTSGATTWSVDSRGTISNPPTGAAHNWAQGYVRARPTLNSHTLSNASLGGAEPSTFAYPDQVFVEAVIDASTYRSGSFFQARTERGSAGTLVDQVAEDGGSGTTRTFQFTADSNRIDGEYDEVGLYDLVLTNGPSPTFGGDEEYDFLSGGNHETGWTYSSGDLVNEDRFTVDSRVTFDNQVLDAGTIEDIFNRGQTVGGTVDVSNARGEGFAAIGSHVLESVDIDSSNVEEAASFTRNGATLDWDITFATSGNEATSDTTNTPPTDAGKPKKLQWSDSGAANAPTIIDNTPGQYARLSSSYNLTAHMQLNDNTHDPALNTTFRQNSDLGFVTMRVFDRRGNGVNGVSMGGKQMTLKDDNDFVDKTVNNGSHQSATRNGFAGFFKFLQWDNQLPGGRWDFWLSDGSNADPPPDGQLTHNGNTAVLPRRGVGTSRFVLLAPNPNIELIMGAGPTAAGIDGHWNPDDDFVVGLALIRADTETVLEPDTDVTPNVNIFRFNQTTGRGEYLDTDLTWKTLPTDAEDPDFVLPSFNLTASPTDDRIYLKTFTNVDITSNEDIFVVARAYRDGTPYANSEHFEVVAGFNQHGGYELDPVAFALGGQISFR